MGLPDIQENNEQILNNIQSLQTMEQQLFNSLETNPNLSAQQQQQIVEKMNQISNMRINLYQTLTGVNGFFQNALASSHGTLQEQTAAIAIVEHELNQAKRRLEVLEAEKNNKIRLVEINDYYGEKYAEHASLMKIIIFTLVPIIILAILNNKGFLPNTIYYGLVTIISLIGAYFFWKSFASIIMRDPMNYQEYDWGFNPANAPKGSASSTDPWATLSVPGTCVGQACCSAGQTWDSTLNQCVGASTVSSSTPPTSSSSTSVLNNLFDQATVTVEPFENNINKALTKTQTTNKYKQAANNLVNVKPNTGESFIYKK